MIAGLKGDVLVPQYGYLPALAGKKTYAHLSAIRGIMFTDNAMKEKLANEIAQVLREKRFSAIIVDPSRGSFFPEELEKYYFKKRPLVYVPKD